MKTYTTQVIGPSHWASYLINGDATGFDYSNTPSNPDAGDKELAQAQAFEKWAGGSFVDAEDSGFVERHDARRFGALPCECSTFTVLIHGEGV